MIERLWKYSALPIELPYSVIENTFSRVRNYMVRAVTSLGLNQISSKTNQTSQFDSVFQNWIRFFGLKIWNQIQFGLVSVLVGRFNQNNPSRISVLFPVLVLCILISYPKLLVSQLFYFLIATQNLSSLGPAKSKRCATSKRHGCHATSITYLCQLQNLTDVVQVVSGDFVGWQGRWQFTELLDFYIQTVGTIA